MKSLLMDHRTITSRASMVVALVAILLPCTTLADSGSCRPPCREQRCTGQWVYSTASCRPGEVCVCYVSRVGGCVREVVARCRPAPSQR